MTATRPSSSCQIHKWTWNCLWKLRVPPKVRHFWWKVLHNALASREDLFYRRCAPSPSCQLCDRELESIEHILFRCAWTRNVWKLSNVIGWVAFDCVDALGWFSSFLGYFDNLSSAIGIFSFISSVGWSIWLARNEFMFSDATPSAHKVVVQARGLCVDFSRV